jgi:hypothetical protein
MCPNCGAANPLYVVDLPRRVTDPKTIAELQEYCAERGMPLLRMRFFIGEDIKEPKAFGIYKDSHGDCIVYKNKADGTRAVRYRGPDEEHAVREIYDKLLEECRSRGIYPDGKPTDTYREAPQDNYGTSPVVRSGGGIFGGSGLSKIIVVLVIIFAILIIAKGISGFSHGLFLGNLFGGSGGSGNYSVSTDYDDYNDYGGDSYYNDDDNGSGSSWWWNSDDNDNDDSGSSWWSSDDDDDDDSWWSSDDDDDDWGSSWDDDDDWGSSWDDWDSDDSDWDSDW